MNPASPQEPLPQNTPAPQAPQAEQVPVRIAGADILPTSADIAPAQLKNPVASLESEDTLESPLELINQRKIVAEDDAQAYRPGIWRNLQSRNRLVLAVLSVVLIASGSFAISSFGFGNGGGKNNNQTGSNFANLGSGSVVANDKQAKLQINYDTQITQGRTLSVNGSVVVQNDLANGFSVQNASGSNLIVADTATGRVGIGQAPTGSARLQVNGDVSINGNILSPNGGFSLSGQGLTLNGVLVCTTAGCISNTSQQLNGYAKLNGNNVFTGVNSFTAAGNVFTGDGSGLTALDAGNIITGTLNDNRLSGNVALTPANNNFTGANTFSSQIQASGGIDASAYSVGGTAGAAISCSSGDLIQNATVVGGIITSGSCVAGAGASTPTLQEVYDSSAPAHIVLSAASGLVQVQDAATPLGTNLFEVTNNGGATKYFAVSSSGISITGTATATNFSGSGSGLTNVNAAQLGGQAGSYYTNAANISTGTLNDSRLSANVTKAGNTFNGASQLVQLTAGGILPVLNGSNLTSLNAGSISSGTLNDSRLSTNVALLSADNIFLGDNSFHLKTKALSVQDAATPLGVDLFTVTDNTGATKYFSVSAAGAKVNGNDICTTAGNCTGVSGGSIGGSGTAGKVAIFTGSGFTIGDSLLSQAAGVVTAAGSINVTSGNDYQINNTSINVAGTLTNVGYLDGNQTFSGSNTFSNSITAPGITAGGAALGIGASGDTLNLNGTYSSTLVATNGTNSTTIGFAGVPVGNVVYDFDAAETAGTYTICTTAGNCTGVSGGSIGGSGTAGKLAKFTGSGFTIGDSILSDNGTTVSVAGTLNATTLQQGGTNVLLQTTSFSGDVSGSYNSLSVDKLKGTALSINTLADTNFLVYNSSTGNWENHSISGDITVNNSGVASIGTGKVTSLQIADGTITSGDLSVGLASSIAYVAANNDFSGNNTFDNSIAANGGVNVGTGQSIVLTGGATGTRPAGPTAGTLYFDTTTKQLIQYNGTKWVSDRSTATKIVAASNSTQAEKDAADYVATGTSDETTINSALTALPLGGGTVYLMEGTYSISASISVPNNTTLAGAGAGTVITIPNGQNGAISMITNSDTATGTNVTIRDLMIDGNKANQTAGAGPTGVYFNGMGAGAGTRKGGLISNVTVKNLYNFGDGISLFNSNNNVLAGNTSTGSYDGILIQNSSNNTLKGNTVQGDGRSGIYLLNSTDNTLTGNIANSNSQNGLYLQGSDNTASGNTADNNGQYGIYMQGATTTTVSGNIVNGNASYGIYLSGSANNNTVTANTEKGSVIGIVVDASTGNTVAGNIANGNNTGIQLSTSANNNSVTGNTVNSNAMQGFYVSGSSNNIISGNKLDSSGGSTDNKGIYLASSATKNSITGNDITDTSCTTTCYAINISDAGSTGNYLASNHFLGDGTHLATINDATASGNTYSNQPLTEKGDASFRNAVDSATAFQIQNAAGTALLNVDTSTPAISLSASTTITGTNSLTVNGGLTTLGAGLTETGAALFKSNSATGFQVQDSSSSKAVMSVDTSADQVVLGQSSSLNGALTFANSAGANTVTLTAQAVNPASSVNILLPTAGASGVQCLQSTAGSTTTSTTLIFNSCAGASIATLQQSYDASGSPQITLDSSPGAGGLVVQDNATPLVGSLFTVQSNGGGSKYLDVTSSGVTVSTLTSTGVITANGGISVAANQTIAMAGGATGSRPGSPTKGTLFYDTTTNNLIQYNGSKWVSAPKTATVIVAASDSTQAEKDAADYVATGTSDETTINSALTALPLGGGTVYLMEGTYYLSNSISIPDATALVGSGPATVITLPIAQNGAYGMITNSDTTFSAGRINIQNMTIDGSGQSGGGPMYGIYINGFALASHEGAKISNVNIRQIYGEGIYVSNSYGTTITGNTFSAGSNTNNDIKISNSQTASVTGNIMEGAGTTGILLDTSSNVTITGNTIADKNIGVDMSGATNNAVSGNTIQGSTADGIDLSFSSNNNNISGNKIHDSGGSTLNEGININLSNKNTISDNDITDTSCTFSCYAIDLNGGATGNYLSSNHFLGDGTNAASILDGGGNTYSNQPLTENGDASFRNAVDSTSAFQIQNASGNQLLNVNSSGSQISVGPSAASYSNTVYTLDASAFAAQQQFSTGSGSEPLYTASADFNQDGRQDIVTSNGTSNNLAVLLANGSGGFNAYVSYVGTGGFGSGLSVGNLNGDAYPDIVAGSSTSGDVAVFINNGDGTFAGKVDYVAHNIGISDVALGDVNNDGKPDIITSSENGGNGIETLLNSGTGTFGAASSYTNFSFLPDNISSCDVNDDGYADAVITTSSKGIFVMKNKGNGTFDGTYTYSAYNTLYGNPTTSKVKCADLNGDGYPDFVYTDGSYNLAVMMNNGDGTYSTPRAYTSERDTSGEWVTIGDINGDGYPDIAVADLGNGDVALFLNKGNGTFGPYTSYALENNYPYEAAIGDFNNDGHADIAASEALGDDVSVLFGNGVTSTTANHGGALSIYNPDPNLAALNIQGAAGQTGDLLHIQDSTGTALLSVNSTGNLQVNSIDSLTQGNGNLAIGANNTATVTIGASTSITKPLILGDNNNLGQIQFAGGTASSGYGFTLGQTSFSGLSLTVPNGNSFNIQDSLNGQLLYAGNQIFRVSGESAGNFQIQQYAPNGGTFFPNLLNADTANMNITIQGKNTVIAGLSPPTSPSASAGSNTTGSLSGSASTTYYFKVASVTGTGESLPSSEVSINGQSFTKLSAPAAPAGSPAAGATMGIGNYHYKLTVVTPNGETTAGSETGAITTTGGNQNVTLTLPAVPNGATGFKVYRTAVNGALGSETLVTAGGCSGVISTSSCTDSATDAQLSGAPPVSNTATTNKNAAVVNWTAASGVSYYKVYIGTTSGGENGYQIDTLSSTSYTVYSTSVTAGAPLASSTAGRLGIGTSSPAYTLDVNGDSRIQSQANSATAFQIQNSSGRDLLSVDAANSVVQVGNTTDGSNIVLSATGNANSTIRKSMNVGGTVNAHDVVVIDSSANGQVKTTTTANDSKVFGIATGSGTPQDIVIGGTYQVNLLATNQAISPGDYLVTTATAGKVDKAAGVPPTGTAIGQALESKAASSGGTIWVYVTPGAGGTGNSTTFQQVYDSSASSPQITLDSSPGAGGLVVQDNATPLVGSLFTVQSNGGGSKYLDVSASSGVTVSALTSSGLIIADNGIAVSPGQTITLGGGNTASRPATPTAGTLYYDTTTNNLIQYNGSKWVSAPRSNTFIIAASNSTQAEKDAADAVATGTGDQATINGFFTSVPCTTTGCTVYLMEGTYNISAAISVPNNSSLIGAGTSTVITIPNAQNGTYNMIQNADTTTGTNVTIRDLMIDGNSSNQTSGSMVGVFFSGVGASTTRAGGTINNLVVKNLKGAGQGVYLSSSYNNNISGTTIMGVGGSGIFLNGASSNTITNNNVQGPITGGNGISISGGSVNNTISNNIVQNFDEGIALFGGNNVVTANYVMNISSIGIQTQSSNNTITGNTVQNSQDGIILNFSSTNNVVSGNLIQGNASHGIYIKSSSTNNDVAGNKIYDNGGSTANNGIYFSASSTKNSITDNDITDSSCTTTCYAINISDAGSAGNYLASNHFLGDGTHAASINDATSGGNTYSNQPLSENGDASFRNATDSATAFQVQKAGGTALLSVDTSGNNVYIGVTGSTNVNSNIHIADSTAGVQTVTIGSTNSTSSTTIQGGTGAGAISLQAASSGTILLGTTNANAISLGGNTTLSAGKFLKLTGSGTRPSSPTDGTLYYDTSTHQLIAYSSYLTKWVSAPRTSTMIVAASNSSQAEKDAADFVASGSDDGATINNAIALLPATGGSVYLMEGTYTLGATNISVPNNTTISGSGSATILKFQGALGASNHYAITNTDTVTGTNVTVQNLLIDGNRAAQSSGGYYGIYFNGMGGGSGSGARIGAKISNVTVQNIYSNVGIYLTNSSNNTVTGSTVLNAVYGIGLVSSSNYNTITNNNVQGNSSVGIYLNGAVSNDTISGNTIQGNGEGIESGSSNSTFTGNTIQGSSSYGIYLGGSSNTVSGNNIYDNGGASNNQGIFLQSASKNSITGNDITDSSCTTTCYAINVSDSGSSKNYLSNNHFSGSAANAASINDAGTNTIYANQQTNSTTSTNSNVTDFMVRGSANSTTAFQIQNASGRALFTVDTSGSALRVGNTTDGSQISLAASGNANAVITKNMPVGGTVNAHDLVVIDSSTNGQVKTTTTASDPKVFGIATTNTTPQDIVIGGTYQVNLVSNNQAISPGDYLVSTTTAGAVDKASGVPPSGTAIGEALESKAASSGGTIWVFITPGAGGTGVGGSTTLQQAYDYSTTSPQITLDSSPGAGGFVIQDNATPLVGSLFTVQSNGGGSKYLDVTSSGVTVSTLTSTGLITANGGISVAANQTISMAGGATGSRPGSPTKGTLFYDTTTNNLVQYNGSKWVSAPRSSTFIVAANNSTQAEKDAADAVATGTGDQATINSFFTSAPCTTTGCSVYLMEGTYTLNNSISISNNSTLSGAGAGTVITVPNGQNGFYDMVTNSDTSTGTGVIIQNLMIDGNKANQSSGDMDGISLNSVGSSTRAGGAVRNVIVQNVYGGGGATVYGGIKISNDSGVTVSGSVVRGTVGQGIIVESGTDINIVGNTIKNNSTDGIFYESSINGSITGNVIDSNDKGIWLYSGAYGSITGNSIYGSATYGIYLYSSANNYVVSGNKIFDSGGSTVNNGIYLASSSVKNSITGNDIADSSCTTSCYAINISDSGSTGNYLASNHIVGDGTHAAVVHDLTTSGNTYSNQPLTENGDASFRNATNSTTAFQVQNASGTSLLSVDTTTNNRVQIGSSSTDATADLFVLDSYNNATDPTGVNGSMYYNSSLGVFRCYQGGAWTNCIGAAGTSSTLQQAYDASTAGSTPEIVIGAVTNTTGVDIQNKAGASITGASLFAVRDKAANNTTLGTALFNVSDKGETSIKTTTNSTTAFQVQNSGNTSLLNVNTINNNVALGSSSILAWGGLTPPTGVSLLYWSNTGAKLPGTTGATWYYKVTALNSKGEGLGSTEVSIPTSSFTHISAPGAPTAAVNATAGNLNGTYTYKVTFVTASGGETTGGTASASVSPVSQQVNLTSIPTTTTSSVSARRIYRSNDGGVTYKLVTTINDRSTTTAYTDNIADGSLGASIPVANTANTDTNDLRVSWNAVSGATSYNVYRGTTSNAENILLGNTTSTQLWEDDSNNTYTSKNIPTIDTSVSLGISTTSAPAASLDVRGTAIVAADSASLFQIQNAAGSTLLKADTSASSNGKISISSLTTIQGWGKPMDANEPTGHIAGVSVVYGNNMYVYGGKTGADWSAGVDTTSMDIYNLSTGNWTTGASGGTTGLKSRSAVVYNGKIYIYGGWQYGSNASNVLDIYDIGTNTWSTGPTGPTARGAHSAVVYNGKMYVWGGLNHDPYSSATALNTMDIYDFGTNTWSTGTTGGTARGWPAGVVYNGKMYEWGGTSGAYVSSDAMNTMDVYDFGTNTWSTGTTGGTARAREAYALNGTKLYLWGGVSGNNGNSAMNTMDIVDLSTNTWSTGTAGGTARLSSAWGLFGNRLYITGGAASVMGSAVPAGMDVVNLTGGSSGTLGVNDTEGGSLLNIDTINNSVSFNDGRLVVNGLSAPTGLALAAGSNSSGSFSGAAGSTWYYRVSAINNQGETLASSESSFSSTSFTPLAQFYAYPTVAVNATAGNLNGTYYYNVTCATSLGDTGWNNNYTTAVSPASQQVNLTNIPTCPGATARYIYRTVANDSIYYQSTHYFLVATLNDDVTTTYTDNIPDASLGSVENTSNTARTTTNSITVSWTAVAGASSYRIYRGTAPGAETAYQTATTSPFTDTGVAGTTGSVATTDMHSALGIGTSAPAANLDVRGTVFFKNQVDSSNAFQVQNASGAAILTANTSGLTAQIGSSTADSNAVILVLDSYNNATDPAGTNGAMYYNTALNKFRCYENGAWTNCAGGSSSHTKRIRLSPEYAGATMTGDGTNNTGTMTSDNMTSSPFRSYYKWTNTQGTAQDYDIWVRVPLPSDFSSMPANQTICLDDFASATTAGTVTLTLYDTNGTVVGSAFDLTPTSASTWQTKCTTAINAGTYAANGVIVLDFKLTAPATTGDVRIGDFYLDYTSSY